MKKCLKRTAGVLAAIMLTVTITPFAGAEEEFDDQPWIETVAMSSTNDVADNTGSAILMEKETGTVLYEHNIHQRLAPASVTKVMTMLLIAERIEAGLLSMEDMVTCSSYAASMGGSQIFLEEGEQMSVDSMLKSVAVASANDAAVALAEHISGSEDAFVKLMNQRAAQLGMNDTVFANCTGLPSDSEHLTSAYDIAVMSRELIRHDFIKEYTTIWMDTVRDGQFGLSNTNKLVRFYQGATGLKTGFTQEAMYCLSATAERDGVEYIAVIMHAATSDIRFESAKLLLNYAFANYTVVPVTPDQAIAPVKVIMGKTEYIQPQLSAPEKILLEKSAAAQISKSLELVQSVEAPVTAGTELGRLTIRDAAGSEIVSVPLVAAEPVERMSWAQVFGKYLRLMFTGRK